MANQPKGSIVGLGVTPMGKIYGRRAVDFAAEAIALALDDAGLTKNDIDGLLINANIPNDMDPRTQMMLGFENLTLINVMNGYGSTAGAMMQYACMAIREGLAKTVVLVYADAPLTPTRGAGQSYSGPHRFPLNGMAGLKAHYGDFGANLGYAMAARRHMHLYGTTEDHFGTIAVGQRKWAQMSPWAQMKNADDDGGSSQLALDRRAAASARLLSRLQRRGRGNRDVTGARTRPEAAAGACTGLRDVRTGRQSEHRAPSGGRNRCETVRRDGIPHGGHHTRRYRNLSAL